MFSIKSWNNSASTNTKIPVNTAAERLFPPSFTIRIEMEVVIAPGIPPKNATPALAMPPAASSWFFRDGCLRSVIPFSTSSLSTTRVVSILDDDHIAGWYGASSAARYITDRQQHVRDIVKCLLTTLFTTLVSPQYSAGVRGACVPHSLCQGSTGLQART